MAEQPQENYERPSSYTRQEVDEKLRDMEVRDRIIREMEAERKKNEKFVQMTERRISDIRKHIRHNAVAVDIFLFLAKHMDHQNIVVCPTNVLMEETDKGRTTVSNAIKYLKSHDLVDVIKVGTTNAYALNGEYVWKTFNHSGRYSVFENARTLVAHSDNRQLRKRLAHVFQPELPFKEEGEE